MQAGDFAGDGIQPQNLLTVLQQDANQSC